MAPQPTTPSGAGYVRARDVVAFGQEVGRVLSDGRIVGRAEPFAKVFPSSRAVKRAVGVTAWAILEDIALDATLDAEGRLVAETNVRRIADNLGLSKNTVTKHLGRLREHGFVLHEEQRDDGTGRYETSRYVLDPSACLERFTHTPKRGARTSTEPRPKNRDTGTDCDPRPRKWDTATPSQSTGHRDVGQKNKKVVAEGDQQPQPAVHDAPLIEQLTAVGVALDRARELVTQHPERQIVDVLDAVEVSDVRSAAGWVVTALRDGWDVSEAAEERRKQRAARRLRAEEGALRRLVQDREDQRRRRAADWEEAVSAALDDAELAVALREITEPVAALGRRSAPMAVSQLVGWAAACHAADPTRPLDAALAEALRMPADLPDRVAGIGTSPVDASAPGNALPEPPAPTRAVAPLRQRVAELLPAIDHDLPTPTTKEEHQ
jgi:DNA-binding transcriptional ArsR family regulator